MSLTFLVTRVGFDSTSDFGQAEDAEPGGILGEALMPSADFRVAAGAFTEFGVVGEEGEKFF